jgi:hypothetical protein
MATYRVINYSLREYLKEPCVKCPRKSIVFSGPFL